jgi:DNA-binding winged helix-turn-helix (wHTH) protein
LGWTQLATCRVDLERELVDRVGTHTPLTTLEARLLGYLMRVPGADVPREELLSEVWGYRRGVASRSVDNTVQRLRKKLEPPGTHRHIVTVRGVGYRFVPAQTTTRRDPVMGLVGRDEAIASLELSLATGVAVILGPPGVGKTALARATADALAAPCLWVTTAGARTVDEAAARLARALHVDARYLDAGTLARAARIRGLRRVTLDEVETCAHTLGPLIAGWRRTRDAPQLVLTSRVMVAGVSSNCAPRAAECRARPCAPACPDRRLWRCLLG